LSNSKSFLVFSLPFFVFFKAERELVGKLLMKGDHRLGHSSVMDIVNAAWHDTGYSTCTLTSISSIYFYYPLIVCFSMIVIYWQFMHLADCTGTYNAVFSVLLWKELPVSCLFFMLPCYRSYT
jgi:hypothetical protein